MNVGERLDLALIKIMKNKRYGTVIAKEMGVTAQAISQLKKKEKSNDLMRKIAENKGISLTWLEFGEGLMMSENDMVSDIPISYGHKNGSVSIPYHKEVYASAGGGSDATSMVGTSPITFSKEFLNNYLGIHNLQGLSIISAAGDSMNPTIKSGELMFVYPVKNEGFKDGGIYVVMCGDALLVKRVWLNPVTKEYTLSSDNDTVEDQVLTMDEGSDCRFVGRVVGHLDRV